MRHKIKIKTKLVVKITNIKYEDVWKKLGHNSGVFLWMCVEARDLIAELHTRSKLVGSTSLKPRSLSASSPSTMGLNQVDLRVDFRPVAGGGYM